MNITAYGATFNVSTEVELLGLLAALATLDALRSGVTARLVPLA